MYEQYIYYCYVLLYWLVNPLEKYFGRTLSLVSKEKTPLEFILFSVENTKPFCW